MDGMGSKLYNPSETYKMGKFPQVSGWTFQKIFEFPPRRKRFFPIIWPSEFYNPRLEAWRLPEFDGDLLMVETEKKSKQKIQAWDSEIKGFDQFDNIHFQFQIFFELNHTLHKSKEVQIIWHNPHENRKLRDC